MDLLIEMWPESAEQIKFAHDDNFKEWASMLFQLKIWDLKPCIVEVQNLHMLESLKDTAEKELESYKDLEDYGYISVAKMGEDLHLMDGYHRVLLAKQRGTKLLDGALWVKAENNHPNCQKIKKLIINNL